VQPGNLLLINPWIYDFAAYDFWAKPLGLLYLGGLLEKNGWNIDFIDCLDVHHPAVQTGWRKPKRKHDHRGPFYKQTVKSPAPLRGIPRLFHRFGIPLGSFKDVLRAIPSPRAVLVTSGMTYWYWGVHEAIKVVKELFPHAPVILGGIYASLCPAHAEGSGADFVVRGQGELQVLALLEELTGVSPLYQPDAGVLDSLPYPGFHLYPQVDYVCVLGSRGCPFSCSYCASPLLNPKFLTRDPIAVVREILHWTERHGVEDVAFYDDAFLSDQEFVVSLLREIRDREVRVRFHTPNGLHARSLTGEVAGLMRQVGFATVRIGLETSCSDRQLATGGKVNNEQFREAVQNLRRAGYSAHEIGVYVLVGLPRQTRDEVEATIQFVWQQGARPYLAEYSPLPGTPIWEEAMMVSPFDLDGEPLFQNNTLLPCRWDGLTWEDLQDLKSIVHSRTGSSRCNQKAKVL